MAIKKQQFFEASSFNNACEQVPDISFVGSDFNTINDRTSKLGEHLQHQSPWNKKALDPSISTMFQASTGDEDFSAENTYKTQEKDKNGKMVDVRTEAYADNSK